MYAGRTFKIGLEKLPLCSFSKAVNASAPAAGAHVFAAGRALKSVGHGSHSAGFFQPKRTESTVTAFGLADSVLPGDYNDHEEWYEQTRTKPSVASFEEGQQLTDGGVTLVPRSASAAANARSFEELPGPRGLPVIGNVLSYSRFGKCACDGYLLLYRPSLVKIPA
jgi:hypothetical protein